SGLLERYAEWLPITETTPRLSLHEGGTPLIRAPRLADWVGVRELFLKYEGLNPTGSFKDRGMVVAVAKALEEHARTVICASTGNTAASAAAYAARAHLECVVLLPSGQVALGKVAQAVMYGARVVVVDSNFDGALDLARTLAQEHRAALVNSVNPYRIEGQTTSAFEICETLGNAPTVLALPLGNGGNITAYWLGFRRFHEKRGTTLPRVFGIQAAGAAPFVAGKPIANPETIATAIRIGKPATWQPAIDAAHDSGGQIRAVTDEQILEAYRHVARLEGVFCEPASAASVAGLRAAARDGTVGFDARCVCVLTGNGLKDPESAMLGVKVMEVAADAGVVSRALRW
ncbi:MAG TPA: threonine synthase, partial [Longimicrobiales bacterium]